MTQNIEPSAKTTPPKQPLVWRAIIFFTVDHLLALYGLYYFATFQIQWKTLLWSKSPTVLTDIGIASPTCFLVPVGGLGCTAGSHRLWSHRSFKAALPLRLFLCFCNTLALQGDIIGWARDHRVHHKFSDTDADPYNARRGFFFSHIGWLLVRKHPDVLAKGKTVDASDLTNDPILNFQRKYYLMLGLVFFLLVPTMVPVKYWNENFWISLCFVGAVRHLYILHCTFSINSAAHMWGMRPYDVRIKPAENLFVATVTFGEGWHNYHHTFPWDYKAVELDKYSGNLSTGFIHLMAKIGWAYDLRSPTDEMVKSRMMKTGAGKTSDLEYYADDIGY